MVVVAYLKYIGHIGKEPTPIKANYKEIIQIHNIFVLHNNKASAVVGSIILGIDKDSDSVKINNLVVDPTSQGRGYRRMLINYAEDFATLHGYPALTLFTNVKMYENLALYPKMGFVETERKTESGYKRVYFRKSL